MGGVDQKWYCPWGMARIGPYEVLGPLGAGGMSEVTLARADGERLVVLKRQKDPEDDPFLLDEARVGMRLKHPGVVQTLGTFYDQGRPILVLEYVQGVMINSLLGTGALSPREIGLIGGQIADALAALHNHSDERGAAQPVVHRDVTPGNVLVDLDGNARLIDLGIARWAERRAPKTQIGFVKGTPRYLAPEVYTEGTQNTESDVWSLGVTLYELALGRHIELGALAAFVERICTGKLVTPAEKAAVGTSAANVLDGLVALDKLHRWQAPEAARQLRGLIDDANAARRELRERVVRAGGQPVELPAVDPEKPAGVEATQVLLASAASTFGSSLGSASGEPAASEKSPVGGPALPSLPTMPPPPEVGPAEAGFQLPPTQIVDDELGRSSEIERRAAGFESLPPTLAVARPVSIPDLSDTPAQARFDADEPNPFFEHTHEQPAALMLGLAARSMKVRADDDDERPTQVSPPPVATAAPAPISDLARAAEQLTSPPVEASTTTPPQPAPPPADATLVRTPDGTTSEDRSTPSPTPRVKALVDAHAQEALQAESWNNERTEHLDHLVGPPPEAPFGLDDHSRTDIDSNRVIALDAPGDIDLDDDKTDIRPEHGLGLGPAPHRPPTQVTAGSAATTPLPPAATPPPGPPSPALATDGLNEAAAFLDGLAQAAGAKPAGATRTPVPQEEGLAPPSMAPPSAAPPSAAAAPAATHQSIVDDTPKLLDLTADRGSLRDLPHQGRVDTTAHPAGPHGTHPERDNTWLKMAAALVTGALLALAGVGLALWLRGDSKPQVVPHPTSTESASE